MNCWLICGKVELRFVAVARPDHALFDLNRELTPDDLVRHVQAVVRDSGVAHPRDEGWLGAERRFTVSSMEASLATILAGLAYAWLPEHLLAEGLRSGALKRLPLAAGGSRNVSLHIVLARPDLLGPAGRARGIGTSFKCVPQSPLPTPAGPAVKSRGGGGGSDAARGPG